MGRDQSSSDCLIIGAGIAGLLAGTVMSRRGWSVQVLEKGRGLGGRMATRRRDGAVFDHGAQFFTVRDERFAPWVDDWKRAGIVEPWYELGDSGTHYRGAPGMTAIGKHLARDLAVERDCLVERLGFDGEQWTATSADSGERFTGRHLLLTAPVPQSLALLSTSDVELPRDEQEKLEAIRFHRCIAALAILKKPSAITDHGGALKLDGEPIQWIADNWRKGISTEVPSVTIHSTPAFAEEHWDHPDDKRLPLLLKAAAPHLGAVMVSCESRRWGFSQPAAAFDREAYVNGDRRFAIAGDGLAGGRVEGAALSGLAAAQGLLEL